ncbi:hypothetical protein ACJDT4_17520 [Clostridium neuense]|uniref:DUF4367 domain-containing protein n=1 Tax=Clostridium neuense TaxID=1728934 RepID=A0ABW8TL27_9CLOT
MIKVGTFPGYERAYINDDYIVFVVKADGFIISVLSKDEVGEAIEKLIGESR